MIEDKEWINHGSDYIDVALEITGMKEGRSDPSIAKKIADVVCLLRKFVARPIGLDGGLISAGNSITGIAATTVEEARQGLEREINHLAGITSKSSVIEKGRAISFLMALHQECVYRMNLQRETAA